MGLWSVSPLALLGIMASPYVPGTVLPVAVYSVSAALVVGGLGGTAGTRPAFVTDIWGPGPSTALIAKSMPVLFLGSFVGPRITAYCRERAVTAAAMDLLPQVDSAAFQAAFHAPKEDLALLLQKKTVTLPALAELCGPNV